MNKEDFNKVWKDSTRKEILNQYYYDYIELRKVYSIIKEARELIKKEQQHYQRRDVYINANELLEILDKVGGE